MSKGMAMPLGNAKKLAEDLIRRIRPTQAIICGSIRREEETVNDIDLAVITDVLPADVSRLVTDGTPVGEGYSGMIGGISPSQVGLKKATVMIDGSVQVNLYACTKDNIGAMMFYLTGPAGYGIGYRMIAKRMGMKLDQYGLWRGTTLVAAKTEGDIYRAVGKTFKEPKLRGVK